MSCWRVLELSEQPDGEQIPQLLVKPVFGSDSYTVHLTCLSNIWSEELDLAGLVDRASKEQSPIEVSKQDTAQLAILLDNVRKSLEHSDDAICRITRDENDSITLHTTITLPKPLDSLTWKFYLEKRASTTLKNELILPLLISSHIQHERIAGLISTINDRDKAITRLVDHYESSNLDLAAAFPIISGLKTGRKVVKREQAARHVPALQPFREDAFKKEKGQSVDSGVSTLGLFQRALSECTPIVPLQLKADDTDLRWWTGIPNRLSEAKCPSKSKARNPPTAAKPAKAVVDSSSEETEDEFENHANFKTRNVLSKAAKTVPSSPPTKPSPIASEDDATEEEEDDDLDAPLKSQSKRSSQASRKPPPRAKSMTPEISPAPKNDTPPVARSKVKGFRIGGKAKETASNSPPLPQQDLDASMPDANKEPPSSQINADVNVTPKKAKRTFKIGGQGKGATSGSSQVQDSAPLMADRTRATQSPSAQPPSSPPLERSVKQPTPIVEEEREETAEEKAERRRAELKRKTEEAAKKQAQSKKKRRF